MFGREKIVAVFVGYKQASPAHRLYPHRTDNSSVQVLSFYLIFSLNYVVFLLISVLSGICYVLVLFLF